MDEQKFDEYEAPTIEQILSAEDIEREVLYAGTVS